MADQITKAVARLRWALDLRIEAAVKAAPRRRATVDAVLATAVVSSVRVEDLRALLADHARLKEAEQRAFMTGYEIWVDGFRAAIGREPWDDAEDYAAVRGQAYVRLWLALASRPEGGENV